MSEPEKMSAADAARRKRALQLLSVTSLTAAVIGLVFGAQHPGVRSLEKKGETGVKNSAVTYSELREQRRGPNGQMYEGAFRKLREAGPGVNDPVIQTAEQRAQVLEERRERRAYAGAPPVVPHAIQEKNPAACLACHSSGAEVGGRRAPAMSHAPYSMCTQCHAAQRDESLHVSALVSNYPEDQVFDGMVETEVGERAYEGAPPTIPHPVFMRETCSSCHGTHGALGMRTTHPARQNCKQCHAAAADFDQGLPPVIFDKFPADE